MTNAKHQQWLKNQELSYQAREIETKKEVEALKETINSNVRTTVPNFLATSV